MLLILVYIIHEQDHVEGYLELSAKTKIYFATAVALWDADFYVKVDDDVHVNIGMLILSTMQNKNAMENQVPFMHVYPLSQERLVRR